MSFDFKLRRTLVGLSLSAAGCGIRSGWRRSSQPTWRSCSTSRCAIEDLYEEAIALWDGGRREAFVDRTLEFFTNFYLQDDILTKVDRAAMMSRSKSRAVFLDNDLVDFCRRLPNRFKYPEWRAASIC